MKMKRTCILAAVLLLTGCQSAPADAPPPEPEVPTGIEIPAMETALPAAGSGAYSRPLRLAEEETVVEIPETPEGSSFFLTYRDGETLQEQFRYGPEARAALAQVLPEVRGRALLEPWTPPPDPPANGGEPWPVYGLSIGGVEEDFEAAYCGGVWLDNRGHILRAELDFPALWARFAQAPEERDLRAQPARRELALSGGEWNPDFLIPAEGEPGGGVPMVLTVTGSGLDWNITNQTGLEISTGNRRAAFPQVLLDGTWYDVPTLSGAHYGWTMEAVSTPQGQAFSGSLWREPYGVLPDGDYRLGLRWTTEAGRSGLSAAEFSIRDGRFQIPELCSLPLSPIS